MCSFSDSQFLAITSGLYVSGSEMFKNKLSLEKTDRSVQVNDFIIDPSKDERLSGKKNRSVQSQERPKQVGLARKFHQAHICSYLKKAFAVHDESIEDAENESLIEYYLMKKMTQDFFVNQSKREVGYLALADVLGNVHIYAISDMIEFKNVSSLEEVYKDKFGVRQSHLSDTRRSCHAVETRESRRHSRSGCEAAVRLQLLRTAYTRSQQLSASKNLSCSRRQDHESANHPPRQVFLSHPEHRFLPAQKMAM